MNKNSKPLSISGLSIVLALCTVAGCRQVASLRGGEKKDQNSSEAPKNQPSNTTQTDTNTADAAIANSPKMLLARLNLSDVNLQKSKIEMVSLDQTVAITNGSQAAQAFAAGQPMQLSQGANGPQAANSKYTVLLGARPSSLTSSNSLALDGVVLGGEPYISSGGISYGPTPVTYNYGYGAGYGTAGFGYPGYGYGGFSIIDGICSLISGAVGSITYTMSSFLYYLNPLTLIGNIGVGYGGIGQYPYGGYQYYPYNQIPNPTPYPYNQPNPMPNTTPQYPQQPTSNMPAQPGQPTPHTGQESMP